MELNIFLALVMPVRFKGSCMLTYRILLKDGQLLFGPCSLVLFALLLLWSQVPASSS